MKAIKSIVYNILKWAKPYVLDRLQEDKEELIEVVKEEVKPYVLDILKKAKIKKAEANKIAEEITDKIEETLI